MAGTVGPVAAGRLCLVQPGYRRKSGMQGEPLSTRTALQDEGSDRTSRSTLFAAHFFILTIETTVDHLYIEQIP
jgi:hypothetical protein